MDDILNKGTALQKVTTKLGILKTLASEEEPSYELKILSGYPDVTVDAEITLDVLQSMIKKYTKIRKNLLKEFKKEVKLIK